MGHIEEFMREVSVIAHGLDWDGIESMVQALQKPQRIFFIGLGGSHANAQHAAADFRKLCGLQAFAFDNAAELTARMNDEGAERIFVDWLKAHRATSADAIFVLSVGGGTKEVSQGILAAVLYAKANAMPVFGIVGPHGNATAQDGDHVIRVPVENAAHATPHTEAFQAVIWHALVSHPQLQRTPTKW